MIPLDRLIEKVGPFEDPLSIRTDDTNQLGPWELVTKRGNVGVAIATSPIQLGSMMPIFTRILKSASISLQGNLGAVGLARAERFHSQKAPADLQR